MKGKIIVPLLLASVGAGVVATSPSQQQFSAQAYGETVEVTNVVGNTIRVTNFTSNGTIGNPVTLPTVTVLDETGTPTADVLVPTVTEPSGRKLTASEITGNSFTPTLKGYYTVVYATIASNGTVVTQTDPLRIYVAGEDYSVTLKTNSKYVVPATIPTSTTNALKIPAPYVYLGDEMQDVADAIDDDELEVSIVAKDSGAAVTVLTAQVDSEGEYYYEWMPSTAGIYEVVYKYIKGTVQDYKTQRFVVKNNYDTSDIVLNFTYASSRLTTLTLGVEATLPKINIVDKTTGNAIEGYTDITVEHIGSGTIFEVADDYTFTPNLAGDYRITYKARLDYFGLSSAANTWTIIRDVKDTVAPNVIASNPYTFDAETGEILTVVDATNALNVLYDSSTLPVNISDEDKQELLTKALSDLSYAVPSVVALVPTGVGTNKAATITLPAAYSSDNFSKTNNLTVTRSIRRNINNTISVVDTGFGNEAATYTFEEAGNYTIRYAVKDAANNEKITSYSIKVVSDETDLQVEGVFVKPKLEVKAVPAYTRADGVVTFDAPTVSDVHDSRVQVRVFYYFDNDATEIELTTKNDSGQYKLDLNGVVPALAEELFIKTVAYNDYGQTTESVKKINLIPTNDAVAPEFSTASINGYLTDLASLNGIDDGTINANGYLYQLVEGVDTNVGEPFSQKDTLVLPTMTITDTIDPNVELSVRVIDPLGKKATVSNSVFTSLIGDGLNTFTIGGGTFVANYSGLYTVTYTARDAGGNTISTSFALRVKDTEKPTILLSSFDPFVNAVEVGKFLEMPSATLKDNGVVLDDVVFGRYEATTPEYNQPGITWRLVSGPVENTAGVYGFTPTVAGEYVVVYEGWDASGNTTETKSYTIVASDTIKPTIELEKDYSWLGRAYVENTPVELPAVINKYDGALLDSTEGEILQTDSQNLDITVTVTNSSGTTFAVSEEEVEVNSVLLTRYTFEPTGDDVYTVTYSTIDEAGNTTEIINTLEIGDVTAPELDWDADYELKSEAVLGDTFAIDESKMIITDNQDDAEDIDVTIYMYKPDNTIKASEITGGYSWELDEVGTWQVKITLTDSANKKETYTYSISVTEDTPEESVIEPWLGTTLIVTTAVILAGVVIYFIVTSKGVKGKTVTRRRKSTK